MKHLITLVSIFTLSIGSLMAQTPNPGFESWTAHTGYNTPDSWNNANPTTYITGVFTCVEASGANAHSGKYALELITQTYLSNTAPGIATTGTINTITQAVSPGIATTVTPDSIMGYFKYTSVSGDAGFISFTIFGTSNTDTVAQAYFQTPASTVGSWTRFSAPLVYRSAHAVTTSEWIILSSLNQTTGKVGSVLYVDDIALVTNPSGIKNISSDKGLTVYPNPVSSQVTINNTVTSKATFVLYDITGRKVMTTNIGSSFNTVDVSALPAGMYIYTIIDENNSVIKTDKLIIQR